MVNKTVAEMTKEEMMTYIAALEAGKLKGQRALSSRVSEKTGALSVYGMGRFPVTLYKSQWERLMKEFKPEWLQLSGLKESKDA